ncbi:uncharacterized protein SEPMUDRAFT_151456 [Sphaerulina musiva SO2202]|uniref:Uncharacterized protein n=1 Tax=Sphaerulina musiva (strain SO2202) TaxID=692275 RepID=N1QHC9_SPHMS|nr:uncharacterized protein SEPMUDRAFT_151456 [Sphaerulina musiva SO2202]EMF09434.1 hypothetical protein SEPMUDRAFT_151456 [Sphaerulina musiva SO2202]
MAATPGYNIFSWVYQKDLRYLLPLYYIAAPTGYVNAKQVDLSEHTGRKAACHEIKYSFKPRQPFPPTSCNTILY